MSKYLLVLGSVPHEGYPSTYGGTTILMKNWLDFLENRKVEFRFISFNHSIEGRFKTIRNSLYVLFGLLAQVRTCHTVMINAAANGTFYLSPILILICRLFGKKVVFRKFGGGFIDDYRKQNQLVKAIFNKTISRSDLIFVESKAIKIFFQEVLKAKNVVWFPNVRPKPELTHEFNSDSSTWRFVFASHITKPKGVNVILDVFKDLPQEFICDFYGPHKDSSIDLRSLNTKNTEYKGVLSPSAVYETLCNYDFVLLPTFHHGEGYPGIIIEGMSVGVPSITTHWNAIPEIISHGVNGLMAEPKDPASLKSIISGLNRSFYQTLVKNTLIKFDDFHDESVNKRVMAEIMNL